MFEMDDSLQLPGYFTGSADPKCFVLVYNNPNPGKRLQVQLNHHLICIPLSGEKIIHAALNPVKADEESYFVLPSGSVLMTERKGRDPFFESLLIFFSEAYLMEFCLQLQPEQNKQLSEGISVFPKDLFVQHFTASVRAFPPLSAQDPLHELKTDEFLYYLHRKHPESLLKLWKNTPFNTPNRQLQQVVSTNRHSNLTLAELAFLCNMSLSTFKRQFKEVFGTSPGKYFLEQKITRAKQLLALKHRPSDIYSELGYENLSSFSHEFRKHTGVTPTAFQHESGLIATTSEPIEQ